MRTCRTTAIILLLSASFLFDVQFLFGQAPYYPLAKGNLWEITPYRRIVAEDDTILYHGHRYSILYDTWYSLRTFERASGDTVFEATSDTEWVKFRFDVHSGDTLNIRWVDSVHWDGTIVTIDTATMFGRRLRQWRFSRSSNYVIDGIVVTSVVDSFGVMGEATDSSSYSVAGAVIDGVTYGNVTTAPQGTFPLHTGNLWQYWDHDYQNGQWFWIYGWTEKVIADTLMPNGKVYALMSSDWKGVGAVKQYFMRQEGSEVFIGYNQYHPDSEYVLYDFSKTTHDTMRLVVHPSGSGIGDTDLTIIAADGYDYFFGSLWRRFQDYLTLSLSSSAYVMNRIADGIGRVYLEGEAGTTYWLRGAVIDGVSYGTIVSVEEPTTSFPSQFRLEQNYPNPFNPSTTIRYALPHRSRLSMVVYNTLGQQVATLVDEVKRPGSYEVTFNASGLASGVYVYRLQAGAFVQARKMLLLTRYHLILTNGDRFQVSGVRNCQFQIADT